MKVNTRQQKSRTVLPVCIHAALHKRAFPCIVHIPLPQLVPSNRCITTTGTGTTVTPGHTDCFLQPGPGTALTVRSQEISSALPGQACFADRLLNCRIRSTRKTNYVAEGLSCASVPPASLHARVKKSGISTHPLDV